MTEVKEEWFNTWFNSPYYHILYKNRNIKEAQFFIRNLIKYLNISTNDKILDVACGMGRHSIFLNQLGFTVEGIDLSAKNIEAAEKHERQNLHFEIHDMRESYKEEHFNYAFNMFTSFGYFENDNDNQIAISAIASSLKKDGVLVLDFLNPYRVIHHLVKEEYKVIEGIHFKINRIFDGESIIKEINFEDNGQTYQFKEKVKAIRRLSFLTYFRNANLMHLQTFGDYNLNEYAVDTSDRMIFIVKKL
jgi:2-polyprenyl-3-methyl-5-hydroxy-6-metoxy-1,4-benzoquinol methylase